MTRQEKVVQMLMDGFGEENIIGVDCESADGTIYIIVNNFQTDCAYKGRFAIDKFGDIGEIPEISGELAYLIDLDLRSLDILDLEEKEVK